ncbi:MAG TPA: hypothetical protein VNL97_07060 [Solirubrobacterales bacterium]|nr:hypothetical protein [Solirubrobacterales bacterium]
MEEGRELATVLDYRLDGRLVERVLAATEDAPPGDRLRAGVEAVVELAELDPEGTSEALAALRLDAATLQGLEGGLSLLPERATLALGAAIQLARAELCSADPDLRSRVPELLRWLEGTW